MGHNNLLREVAVLPILQAIRAGRRTFSQGGFLKKKLTSAALWVFVWFPFFTGGVLFLRGRKTPKGLFDYDWAVALFVIAAIAALRTRRVSWSELVELPPVRFVRSFLEWWTLQCERRPLVTMTMASIIAGTIMSISSLRRHWALASNASDLGIFTNAIWNFTFRGEYVSSFKNGLNLLVDHQSPAFWLYVPIFRMFPLPETLLILQALTLAFGAPAVFWLARQYGLSALASALLPLVYWLYEPMRNANAFDFHPETIILPSMLWSIAGLQSRTIWHRVFGTLFLLLALAGKESAPPLAAGVALAWLCGAAPPNERRFTRALAILVLPASVALFLFYTQYLPKEIFHVSYGYTALYAHLGDTPVDVLLSPLTNPMAFWASMLGTKKVYYLVFLLLPLAFLPLLSWRHYPAFVVPLTLLLLPEETHRLGTSYHYSIEPSVGLFWALPSGLVVLRDRLLPYLQRRITLGLPQLKPEQSVLIVLTICALATSSPSEIFRWRRYSPTSHDRWLRQELLPTLDPHSSFSSPSNVAAHLAARRWSHHLPLLYELKTDATLVDMRTLLGNEFFEPLTSGGVKYDAAPIDCVITDPVQNYWPLQSQEAAIVDQLILAHRYKMIYECDRLKLYQKDVEPAPVCIVGTMPTCDAHLLGQNVRRPY